MTYEAALAALEEAKKSEHKEFDRFDIRQVEVRETQRMAHE